jgi:hypothetical protein
MSLDKFMNAGIQLKIEEKSHPLIQGEKPQPITHHHASITWIAASTIEANQLNLSAIIDQRHKDPPDSDTIEDETGWGLNQFGRTSLVTN